MTQRNSGRPSEDLPVTRMEVTLVERPDGRTAATVLSRFPSREAFDQLLAMGMLDGLREAMGQIDPILAEG